MKIACVLTAALCSVFLAGQVPDFKAATPLLGAALRNDTEAAAKLLKEGADPNEGRFFGMSALLLAVVNANEPMTRALLERGADAKAQDGGGNSALMWAVGAESPNLPLVEEMLQRGVDPNARNKMGETALVWAMRRGHTQVAARLQAAGASDSDTIRQSAEKAIALLQTSGQQFVKVSGCASCHHQSLPQMGYAAARRKGFAVDDAVAAQQVKSVMAMYKPLRERMENGTFTPPNPPISVGYALLGLAAEGYAPDETTRAMILTILRTQSADGGFAILPARPPMEASRFTATALGLRSLQLYGENAQASIVRARAWLEGARPMTNEDRAMRLMGMVWAKSGAAEVQSAAADLLARQRPDSGWAQLDGIETDAYATSQALYALHTADPASASGQAYRRGVAYLLRGQLADGSWLVRTRSNPFQPMKDSGFPHGRDQWISAAGTSWAVLVLTAPQPPAIGESAGQ